MEVSLLMKNKSEKNKSFADVLKDFIQDFLSGCIFNTTERVQPNRHQFYSYGKVQK